MTETPHFKPHKVNSIVKMKNGDEFWTPMKKDDIDKVIFGDGKFVFLSVIRGLFNPLTLMTVAIDQIATIEGTPND